MNTETQNQIDADPEFTFPPPEVSQDLNPYQAFESAFMTRIRAHFEPAGVPEEVIVKFGVAYCQRIEDGLAKFARGQLEHGGNLFDRDLAHERTCELIDANIYDVADNVKQASRLTVQI